MRKTNNWVIIQNNPYKIAWDIFIMCLLMFTTIVIPYRLAFIEDEPRDWLIAYYVLDSMFLIDILLWFVTSYTDTIQ